MVFVTQCLERVFLALYVISEAYDVVVSPAGLVGAEVLCTMVSEVVVHDEVGILRGTPAALSLFLHGVVHVSRILISDARLFRRASVISSF